MSYISRSLDRMEADRREDPTINAPDGRKVRWNYRTNEWAATVEEAEATVRATAERRNTDARVSVERLGRTPGGRWRFEVSVDRNPPPSIETDGADPYARRRHLEPLEQARLDGDR